MAGIYMSEAHGVNPSMEVCFWCGKNKGVVLFGKLKGDKKAPRECAFNYEPCDKCKELETKNDELSMINDNLESRVIGYEKLQSSLTDVFDTMI